MGRHRVGGQPEAALSLRGVSKRFGPTLALDRAELTVARGEIHALLGENGSGKSTLIRVLAGLYEPEAGAEARVGGRPIRFPLRPGEPRRLGLRFVHQELALVPSLSVLDNLLLDDLAARRDLRISWRSERRRAAAILARDELDLDLGLTVARLSSAQRASLALARAFEGLPRDGLLVLDEPTVFLSAADTARLFARLRELAGHGASVLLVTHDLAEALAGADRITVLRDGRAVATTTSGSADADALVALIVGAPVPARSRGSAHAPLRPLGHVRSLTTAVLEPLSFELRAGEVIGLTGVSGSGFEAVPEGLFGALAGVRGRLSVGSDAFELERLRPREAVAAGIALVPADRQRQGCVGSLPVGENVSLPRLEAFARHGRLERGRLLRDAGRLLETFRVRPPEPRRLQRTLSGGNQQKALLAKWLATRPRVLLLQEPTQGVDVGVRAEILALIRAAADDGAAVVCATTDYEQLEALCDRVLVFTRGSVSADLKGREVTRGRIAAACLEGVAR